MDPTATVQSFQSFMGNFMDQDLSVDALRTNGVLRKDEWLAFDTAVVEVARQRLNGIADLQNAGLVRNLGGLGVLIDEWEAMSDMEAASVDMSGVTPDKEDSVEFELQGVPIPIIHKGFRVNIRRLLASRKLGATIDVTQSQVAARRVRDKLEDILFNGSIVKTKGRSLYGYTNFPQRTTVTIAGDWDNTPSNIVPDVELMLAAADATFYFGPFNLYVPTNFWSALRTDYNVNYPKTYLSRLQEFSELANIKPADVLGDNEISMVQMQSDVVDLAVGEDIGVVEWETLGGMVQHMKVMAAMAPRLKHDDNGTSGILHGSE